DLLASAGAAERSGRIEQALNVLERATRFWPDLPELFPAYNRLAGRFQRLKVGVVDLPAADPEAAPVLLSPAARRRRDVTETPLFEPARFENKMVRYGSQFFADWESTELGHSVLFRLRPWRAAGDSQPMLSAARLAGMLRHRLEPQDGWYDARFAAA